VLAGGLPVTRFYRVCIESTSNSSGGFVWCLRRAPADVECQRARRNGYDLSTVETIDAPIRSAADVLRLLEEYATHPDNG
jgi:hypothetical protein